MMRCFIEPTEWENPKILLSREESHHLLSVLRAQRGEIISLLDGNGWSAKAELTDTIDSRASVHIISDSMICIPRPSVAIILAQAIPKHSLMDEIIHKATELGVSSIIPLMTDRVIVRLDAKKSQARLERWQRIARESAKQCGAPWIMDIQPVCPLKELPVRLPDKAYVLAASLEKGTAALRLALGRIDRDKTKQIALVVGPEGDFTKHEYEFLSSTGAIAVSFGPLVLRVETAALFGMSVLASEFATARLTDLDITE